MPAIDWVYNLNTTSILTYPKASFSILNHSSDEIVLCRQILLDQMAARCIKTPHAMNAIDPHFTLSGSKKVIILRRTVLRLLAFQAVDRCLRQSPLPRGDLMNRQSFYLATILAQNGLTGLILWRQIGFFSNQNRSSDRYSLSKVSVHGPQSYC